MTIQFTNAYIPLPFDREQHYIGEINIDQEISGISIEQHIEDRINRL